jgi:hypothetical protein
MDCFQGMPLVRGWTLSYDSERLDRCHPVGASRKFLKAGGHNLELQPPPNPGSQMPAHLPFDLYGLGAFPTRIQGESSSLGANYIFHKYR